MVQVDMVGLLVKAAYSTGLRWSCSTRRRRRLLGTGGLLAAWRWLQGPHHVPVPPGGLGHRDGAVGDPSRPHRFWAKKPEGSMPFHTVSLLFSWSSMTNWCSQSGSGVIRLWQMVYLEQFVFILLKISTVLTKDSPLPPHSHHLLLPLRAFAWCWERDLDLTCGREGSVAAGRSYFWGPWAFCSWRQCGCEAACPLPVGLHAYCCLCFSHGSWATSDLLQVGSW